MHPLISASQWSALKMTCVSGGRASGVSYLRGAGRVRHCCRGRTNGVDIGFLVELGWASLIIALRGKGQFALLLFSRRLKFLFLSGPVMYLKHMGTQTTLCPKSHVLSTYLTMCHFDGGPGFGAEIAPWQPRGERGPPAPLQGDSGEVSVLEGAACVGALPPSAMGMGSEETMCESRRESLPASGWCILCLFDFTFFGLES